MRRITEAEVRSIVRRALIEGGPAMLYSNPDGASEERCEECGGSMWEGVCGSCGSSTVEYVSRGMTGMGRTRRVTEKRG